MDCLNAGTKLGNACSLLKLLAVWVTSRMAFVDPVTKLLVVNPDQIRRRFFRRILPWDIVALLPLWPLHYAYSENINTLPLHWDMAIEIVLLLPLFFECWRK